MSDHPTMLVSEHRARTAKTVGLLKAVSDKYEDLEKLSRQAALLWDADRRGLRAEIRYLSQAKDKETNYLRQLYNTNFGRYKIILGVCCLASFLTGLVL